MTNRMHRALNSTTSAFTGLLDESGNPIPVRAIPIRNLPSIDRGALPDFPDDMEARLDHPAGADPVIILFHPPSEMHIDVPLLDRANLDRYVEALNVARLKQAMGETPEDGDGYLVRMGE